MPRSLNASDRSALVKLASSLPIGDAKRKAILAGLIKVAKVETPLQISSLVGELSGIPDVRSVYIADSWDDGYHDIRVVIEPKASLNALGGQSGKIVEFSTSAKGRYQKFYNLPDLRKVVSATRAIVKRSGLTVDSILSPVKVYEYQDQRSKALKEPRLSAYDGNEIRIEVYV